MFFFCDSWDEWVPESRVLKYNELNVQRQKDVQRAHAAQQIAQKGKKSTVLSKVSLKNREGVKDKDTESRCSTPTAIDRANSRYQKNGGSITPTSNDSSSDGPRRKRRYLVFFLFEKY